MNEYSVGEYIIYQNGDKYELGRIKSLREDGVFVAYHEGETGAKTPYRYIHKLINQHCIKDTSLGGDYFKNDTPQTSGVVWTENDMPTPTSYSTSASTADTPQTDSEITRNLLRSDCTGCRFVGWYDTEFPCVNCIRKNKDYYDSEQKKYEEAKHL